MSARRAMRLWQHVFEIDPQEGPLATQAKAGVAEMEILLGNDEAAQAGIDRLIADFNDHPGLPQTIFRIGEEYYNKASQMEKEGLKTESENCLQNAVTVWGKIIPLESHTIYSTHAWYFSGYAYLKMEDYAKAIECCQKVLSTWPNYQFAWSAQYMIADCARKLGRNGGMPKEESAALRESGYLGVINNYAGSPLEKRALRELAGYYVEKKQWGQAIEYYNRLLEKDYGYLDKVYSSMLRCYNELGLTEIATELQKVKQEEAKEEEAN